MEKDTQDTGKRKISVGFIKPAKLERDTIYVQMKQDEHGDIVAKAISNKDFRYGYVDSHIFLEKETLEFKYSGKQNQKEFLEMLKKYNEIEAIEERFESDGLELTRRISSKLKNLEKNLLH
jgi:hypothetical protein